MQRLSEITRGCDVQFGTSGVRGLVKDLSDRVVFAYADAFLRQVAPSSDRLVVGHDLRESSIAIASACAAAAKAHNCLIDYVGVLPTPAIALYAHSMGAPAIVVTGSHIPFDRNGLKFYSCEGEITKSHETLINEALVDLSPDLTTPLPPVNQAAYHLYCQRYLDAFGERSLAGYRIGLYQHSSAGRDLFADLFARMGAEVIALGRTESFVPIDTEAVSPEDEARARQWAQEHSFDVLFSTDGDSDRPLVGDAKGQWLRGDRLGILCAQALQAQAVVTPVSSNSAVLTDGFFDCVAYTKIGSPYVIEGMRDLLSRYDTVVGFEANGGFLVASDLSVDGTVLKALATRDALLPLLAVLRQCRQETLSVEQLDQRLPDIYTYSDRIKGVAPELGQRFIEQLSLEAGVLEVDLELDPVRATDTTDGCRLYFDGGLVVHFRQSGNAPELRCYTEASSKLMARELNARALAWAVTQL